MDLRPPPRGSEDLLDRPLHVLVREYPEVLGTLRREALDLGGTGGLPLRSQDDSEALAAALMEATAWRAGWGEQETG